MGSPQKRFLCSALHNHHFCSAILQAHPTAVGLAQGAFAQSGTKASQLHDCLGHGKQVLSEVKEMFGDCRKADRQVYKHNGAGHV